MREFFLLLLKHLLLLLEHQVVLWRKINISLRHPGGKARHISHILRGKEKLFRAINSERKIND
jgi:hypothetical protein